MSLADDTVKILEALLDRNTSPKVLRVKASERSGYNNTPTLDVEVEWQDSTT